MKLTHVRAEDIVEVEKKGRRFYAVVESKDATGLRIQPIGRETWRSAVAREVVGHYRKSRSRELKEA